MKETLSDKKENLMNCASSFPVNIWFEEDVKEFIKELKEGIKHGIPENAKSSTSRIIKNELIIIDKLAGDKLI